MNKPNQLSLAQFLEELLEWQILLEKAKEQLQRIPGFSCQLLFYKISQQEAVIKAEQLLRYLNGRGLNISKQHAYPLLFYFDGDRSLSVSMIHFQRELLPSSPFRLAPDGSPVTELSEEAQAEFVQVIRLYFDRQRILEVCREELMWIEPWRMFEQIAVKRLGYLTSLQTYLFLDSNGLTLCQEQLNLLMQAMRPQGCHKMTQEVFCELLRPRECSYFETYEQAINAEVEHAVACDNIVMESILLRERIDNQSRLRQGNRSRRRVLAVVNENMQKEDFLRLKIEKAVDQQFRHIRRRQLQVEREARKSAEDIMEVNLDLTKRFQECQKHFSAVEEDIQTARIHSRELPRRFSTPAVADEQPCKPNLIVNVRNTLDSERPLKLPSSLGKTTQPTNSGAPSTTRQSGLTKRPPTPRSQQAKSRHVSQFRV